MPGQPSSTMTAEPNQVHLVHSNGDPAVRDWVIVGLTGLDIVWVTPAESRVPRGCRWLNPAAPADALRRVEDITTGSHTAVVLDTDCDEIARDVLCDVIRAGHHAAEIVRIVD